LSYGPNILIVAEFLGVFKQARGSPFLFRPHDFPFPWRAHAVVRHALWLGDAPTWSPVVFPPPHDGACGSKIRVDLPRILSFGGRTLCRALGGMPLVEREKNALPGPAKGGGSMRAGVSFAWSGVRRNVQKPAQDRWGGHPLPERSEDHRLPGHRREGRSPE